MEFGVEGVEFYGLLEETADPAFEPGCGAGGEEAAAATGPVFAESRQVRS